VIIRDDVSETDVERIHIHENVMRRGIKPGIAILFQDADKVPSLHDEIREYQRAPLAL
jgi:hypothetical protein